MQKIWDPILGKLWKKSRFTSYFYQSVHFMQNESIPTLALTVYTSRFVMFYNKGFIESLSEDEVTGLLVHEMLHVVFNHDHRSMTDGDIYLQNLAQDMVINSYILVNTKTFFSKKGQYVHDIPRLILPKGLPVIPAEFIKETGKKDPAWEELYSWLKDQPREKLKTLKGEVEEKDGFSIPMEYQTAFNDLTEAFSNIMNIPEEYMSDEAYTRIGNMDGLVFEDHNGNEIPTGIHMLRNHEYKEQIDAKKKQLLSLPQKDSECREERAYQDLKGIISETKEVNISSWEKMIKSIVDYSSQSNEWKYTYGRFNRRYFTQGIYSPGRIFKERENLTVVVDVSASMIMTPGDLEAAFGVLEELSNKYVINLLCIDEDLFVPEKRGDSFVKSEQAKSRYIYRKGDWKYIKTGNSGTTFFSRLFNSYMRNRHEMLIIITDGYIYDTEQLKKYTPTLWVISASRPDPFVPPFGQSVQIELKKDR